MAKLQSGTRIYGNVTVDTFVTATGNITTVANVIAPNYLFANGVNILSTVTAGTSLGSSITTAQGWNLP